VIWGELINNATVLVAEPVGAGGRTELHAPPVQAATLCWNTVTPFEKPEQAELTVEDEANGIVTPMFGGKPEPIGAGKAVLGVPVMLAKTFAARIVGPLLINASAVEKYAHTDAPTSVPVLL